MWLYPRALVGPSWVPGALLLQTSTPGWIHQSALMDPSPGTKNTPSTTSSPTTNSDALTTTFSPLPGYFNSRVDHAEALMGPFPGTKSNHQAS